MKPFLPLLCLALALAARAAPAADAPLPPQRTALVFGQTIRYYDVGRGPTVVLLHGLGSSAEGDWGRIIGPLSAHYRVLAPDQLGFGNSAKPLIDYRIQTWVDFLGEFLRERKVGPFALAGESLGGWIAAQYAIQALAGEAAGPSFLLPKPDRLILCDAAGHRPGAAPPAGSGPEDTSSLVGCRNLLAAIFHGPSWRTDDSVRAFFVHSLAKGDGYTIHSVMTNPALAGEYVDGKLGGVRTPALVVWGAEDGLVPLADGRDYAAKIPGARLVVIPDAGHAACIEQPAAFLAAVEPFLAGGR
jgi:pimeloyl-ACP methyl ester carboxylesterase